MRQVTVIVKNVQTEEVSLILRGSLWIEIEEKEDRDIIWIHAHDDKTRLSCINSSTHFVEVEVDNE